MGRGGARRGAGRPRREIADLKLTDGFRATRHAPVLRAVPIRSQASTAMALETPTGIPPVPADVLQGLQPMGAAFATAVWQETEGWTTGELTLLRLAAVSLDDVGAAPSGPERRAAIRVFVSVCGQLGLDRLLERRS